MSEKEKEKCIVYLSSSAPIKPKAPSLCVKYVVDYATAVLNELEKMGAKEEARKMREEIEREWKKYVAQPSRLRARKIFEKIIEFGIDPF